MARGAWLAVVVATLVAAPAGAEESDLSSPPLTLTLTPGTGGAPWTLKVANAGSVPVRVTADPRLVTLDVTPPPGYSPIDPRTKRVTKPPARVTCKLPADARPSNDEGPDLVIPGGRSWTATIDPLFYCFGAKERALLLKGATLMPRLGWAPPPAKRLTRGRGTMPAEAKPPFVAAPVGAAIGKVHAVKEIVGPSVTLTEDAMPAPLPPPDGPSNGLSLAVPEATDVARGVDVGTSVTLTNVGDKPATLLFRESTLGFKVSGPGGSVACGTTRDVASPIRELFTTLAPKGRATVNVLVDAMCPPDTFDEPGVYRVYPRVDTSSASGRTIGLRTFEGVIEGPKPLLLRVRAPRHPKPPVRPALD